MTTSELKSYIDRILGNNIRCILPSYWWKRAFGAVIDKVDEKVEKSELKTINGESVLGEGDLKIGVKSVESVDELSTLEAEVGDMATVGSESLSLVSSSYFPELVSSIDNILEDWNSYKRIGKVEFGEPYSEEGRRISVYIHGKKEYPNGLIMVQCESGEFSCIYYTAVGAKLITLDEVNEKLRNSDYRVILVSKSEQADKTLKLYAYSASADAYIKSDSWDKLAKEYAVSSEEELNALNVENGTIAKVASGGLTLVGVNDLFLSYDVQPNWDKYTVIKKIERKSDEHVSGPGAQITLYDGEISLQLICYSNFTYTIYTKDGVETEIYLDEINQLLLQKEFRCVYCTELELIDSYYNLYTQIPITANAYIKGETWTRFLKEGDVVGGSHEAVLFYMPLNNGLSEKQKQINAASYKKVVEGFNNNRYYDVKVNCVYCIVDATIVANALLTEGRISLMFDLMSAWNTMDVLEDGSATVEEVDAGKGCEVRELRIGNDLSSEDKAWNLETMEMVQQSKCIVSHKFTQAVGIFPANTTAYLSFVLENSFVFLLGIGVNSARAVIDVASDGTASVTYTASVFTVDSSLSETSANPVQNKVVYGALMGIGANIEIQGEQISSLGRTLISKADKTYVDEAIANAITNTLNTPV